MLMIVAGTKNGEILRGLSALRCSLYSVSMVQRPPMPAPHTAPQRVGSVFEKSMPESLTACTPAATPYCMKSSMRRASFGVMYWLTSKSRTDPPMRTGNADSSKRVTGPMPLCPRRMASQADLTVLPTGDTTPRPVTTIRRLLIRFLYGALFESGLAAALVDVVDGLVDGSNLLGILVRDFDLEFLLEGHHQLDRVERIGAQVVDERGIVRDLLLLDAQLFGNDGFDLLLNSAH